MRECSPRRLFIVLLAGSLAAAPALAWSQPTEPSRPATPGAGSQSAAPAQPSRPASSAPSPQDLEPGVNTSATPPNSAPADSGPGGATADRAAAAAPAEPRSSPRDKTSTPSRSGRAPAETAKSPTPAPASPRSGTAAAKAHDTIQLDTTDITGNRELPKVLYIVPWKRSDLGDLTGKPVNSLLDEVLTPVDRDVFRRQNRYYDALKPDSPKDAAAVGSGPKP